MAVSSQTRKSLYGINALSAWIGFGFSLIIETFSLVKPSATSSTSLYGHHAAGAAGAFPRVIDLLSYFTIWSQIVVGVVMTLLFLNPERDGKWLRIFRVDSVLMITVTGIVYNIMIGPKFPPVGLNVYSSFFEHTLTPLLTVLIFLFVGPRHWFSKNTVIAGVALPIVYIFYALTRGAIINQYPYDFIDVVSYGYVPVIITVLAILTASIAMLLLFWLLDSRLSRVSANPTSN